MEDLHGIHKLHSTKFVSLSGITHVGYILAMPHASILSRIKSLIDGAAAAAPDSACWGAPYCLRIRSHSIHVCAAYYGSGDSDWCS